MTENTEAAELRAQLAECQRIISAQADTIAEGRRLLAACESHNGMIVGRLKRADGAQPAEPVRWQDAERVADLPGVDELLQGFAEDPTGDAGTMVVRAVMLAVRQPAVLPESMSRDDALNYYSEYANLCAYEALGYQERIRELETKLALTAASVKPVDKTLAAHTDLLAERAPVPQHSDPVPGGFVTAAAFDRLQALADSQAERILSLEDARVAEPVKEPIELEGVTETLSNGDGLWRSCSGCHELNEGHDTGPYSETLKCHLGGGCSECGGIGAVWDTTDYQAMADEMGNDMFAPTPPADGQAQQDSSKIEDELIAVENGLRMNNADQDALDAIATAIRELRRLRLQTAQQDADKVGCQPDWNNRNTQFHSGWVNELGTLSQHPDAMPGWLRNALQTIYKGLVESSVPPASGKDADPMERFKNPLTPYGLLVRALRIVAGTTLMEMAEALGVSPSYLSGIECRRKPMDASLIRPTATFFAEKGINVPEGLLQKAMQQGGQP